MVKQLILSFSLVSLQALAAPTCFTRIYSPSHIAKNPKQLEIAATLTVKPQDSSDVNYAFRVLTRKPIKGGASDFSSGGYCTDVTGDPVSMKNLTMTCHSDSDRGYMTVSVKGDTATVSIESGLVLFDTMGNPEKPMQDLILDGRGKKIIYQLKKSDLKNCEE